MDLLEHSGSTGNVFSKFWAIIKPLRLVELGTLPGGSPNYDAQVPEVVSQQGAGEDSCYTSSPSVQNPFNTIINKWCHC